MTVKGCCCCLLKSFELLGHLILSLSVRYWRNPNRGFFFSPQEIKRQSCLSVTTLLMICIVTNFMRAGVYSYDQWWGWWLLFDFPHCHGRREQRNCCYTLNLGSGDRTIFVGFVPCAFHPSAEAQLRWHISHLWEMQQCPWAWSEMWVLAGLKIAAWFFLKCRC